MNSAPKYGLSYGRVGLVSLEPRWTLPFLTTFIFLFFEFTALQITFPFLQPLRLLLLSSSLLMVLLLSAAVSGMLDIKEPRTKLLGLFWVLMGLHIPFAYNNHDAYSLAVAMLPYIVVALGIVTFTKSMKQVLVLVHLWLFCHLYQALNATTHGGRGAGGYFADENDVAASLCMAIPVAYFLFLGSRGFKRILYSGCLLVLMMGFLSSFSRGGFVGLVAVGAYCLWFSPRRISSLSTIALLIPILVSLAPPGYWEEMETIFRGTEDPTGEQRVYLWGAAWRMFLANPLWGVGPGSFRYAVSLYEPPGGFHGQYQGLRALHSTHFQVLAELAIPGLLLILGLVYRQFQSIFGRLRQLKRGKKLSAMLPQTQQRPEATQADFLAFVAIGFGGALLGFLAAGAFVSMLYYPQFWTANGILIAIDQLRHRVRLSGDPAAT